MRSKLAFERFNVLSGRCLILLLAFTLSACETLRPAFESPGVKLLDVQMGEQRGLQQFFDIALAIENPNAYPLNIVGINYKVELQGFDVIKGVTNAVPSVAAYGQETMNLELGIGLLEGLKLMNSLARNSASGLNYNISLGIDTGIPLVGIVPVNRSGVIDSSTFNTK